MTHPNKVDMWEEGWNKTVIRSNKPLSYGSIILGRVVFLSRVTQRDYINFIPGFHKYSVERYEIYRYAWKRITQELLLINRVITHKDLCSKA